MRSGRMRYRVRVQRPKDTDRRRGSRVEWQDVHVGPESADGKCWASIRQTRVAEQRTAKQLTIVGSFEIRIWAIPGFDETWRLVHGVHAYNVVSVDQPNLNVRELVVICRRDKLKGDPDAH